MRIAKTQCAEFICKDCGKAFKYTFHPTSMVATFLCVCKKCKKKEKGIENEYYSSWGKRFQR